MKGRNEHKGPAEAGFLSGHDGLLGGGAPLILGTSHHADLRDPCLVEQIHHADEVLDRQFLMGADDHGKTRSLAAKLRTALRSLFAHMLRAFRSREHWLLPLMVVRRVLASVSCWVCPLNIGRPLAGS